MANMQPARVTRWAGHGDDWPAGHRECMKCREIKLVDAFHHNKRCKGGVNSVCKACRVELSKKNYLNHSTEYKLFYRAKRRAKERGLDFDIEPSDIVVPDLCPVFGVPLEVNTIYAASLDRKRSDLGYIKGNIQVLSARANTLKNDATLDELELLVEFIRRGVCELSL